MEEGSDLLTYQSACVENGLLALVADDGSLLFATRIGKVVPLSQY